MQRKSSTVHAYTYNTIKRAKGLALYNMLVVHILQLILVRQ